MSLQLLTVGNPKIEKGRKVGYLTGILHLAPSRLSGYNVCPMASKNCEAVCLNIAGRGGLFAGAHTKDLTGAQVLEQIKAGALQNRIQAARIRRTKLYFENRPRFRMMLAEDIFALRKLAAKHDMIPAVRLNGTSDIRWEYETIIQQNKDLHFYDYTKIPNRRNLPDNYHLTFSRSENNNWREAFDNGFNVAVVFHTVPETWEGIPVINGDETDLRFLDPKGVIVGLKAKGKAKKDASGFVV